MLFIVAEKGSVTVRLQGRVWKDLVNEMVMLATGQDDLPMDEWQETSALLQEAPCTYYGWTVTAVQS